MKNYISLKFVVIMSLFFAFSCSENKDIGQDIPTCGLTDIRAILVSEGQFGYGTSSLTTITDGGTITQNVFRKTNNRPMGDVAQSITRIGKNYYVPLNNSSKVEVFDAETFESVETMFIDRSSVIPMYIADIGDDLIVVSNQSSSGLIVMNIQHGSERPHVSRYVDLDYRTFQMKRVGDKLFIGGDKITVFDINDISTGKERYILNGSIPFSSVDFSKIVMDVNENLWVMNVNRLYCIDTEIEKVIKEVDISGLGVNSWVGSMDISPSGETIYFNGGSKMYSVNVNNLVKPTEPIFTHDMGDNRVKYNMSVSKENTIFFCDVLYGSLTSSRIYEYDTSGKLLQKFNAGIFTHYIYFL